MNNSILFTNFDNNYVQITFKINKNEYKPNLKRTMVITVEELYNNKELLQLYLLSTLLTENPKIIFKLTKKKSREFRVYNSNEFNYILSGFRVICKDNLKHLHDRFKELPAIENRVVSNELSFIYMWNKDLNLWDINKIVESSQDTKTECKKFYKHIMKKKTSKFLLDVLNEIVSDNIEYIEKEIEILEEAIKEDINEYNKSLLSYLFLTKTISINEDISKMIISY